MLIIIIITGLWCVNIWNHNSTSGWIDFSLRIIAR